MSVPQKEKEGPASMLRAVFAGVGSLLSVVDKVRGKAAAAVPVKVKAPVKAEAPATAAAEATAAPEPVAEPETVVAETATPETATPETATPETATPEDTAATEDTGAPEMVVAETATPEETAVPAEPAAAETVATELPLANYDELTVASLRARLRNLTVAQLTQLIDYEKGNAARSDVISMFERRIAKVESEA